MAGDRIRVDLVRSGGFAGITRRASVDTNTLPAEETAELTALLDRLDLDELARRAQQPVRGADRFQYDLTIQRGSARYEMSLPETSVPPDLKPLLTWLLRRAESGS